MPNRYVTDAEKAGAKRRSQAARERLRERGLRQREVWLSDHDAPLIQAIARGLRGDAGKEMAAEVQAEIGEIAKKIEKGGPSE